MLFCCETGDFARPAYFLQDSKCHQSNNALAVGRVLPYLHVAFMTLTSGDNLGIKPQRDCVNLLAALLRVISEIFKGKVATEILYHLDQSLSDSTLIKSRFALPCQCPKCLSQSRIFKYLPRSR